MTGMDDLVTWVRAQLAARLRELDEDERVALAASTFPYEHPSDSPWGRAELIAKAIDGSHAGTVHQHVARWDPERVLWQVAEGRAEVEAKRRILDRYEALTEDWRRLTDAALHLQWNVLGGVVRMLALPYADRPGYLQERRP